MENLYYVGVNMANFALAVLVTQFIWYLIKRFSKSKKKDVTEQTPWYNVVLSVFVALFSGDRALVGIFTLIVTLIIALIGIKRKGVQEKQISNWGFGITLCIIGLVGTMSYYGMWIYIVIGTFWIWLTVYNKSQKFFRLTPKVFSSLILLAIGIIVFFVGNYYDKETAHIRTDDYSVKLGKKEATISGVATPNVKVKTYLDGEEITPSEETDSDGNFSFQAKTPGKWTVKVTKNGKTASDTTIVKKSQAWKDYQAKEGAEKAKEAFNEAYADAFSNLDSIGVEEYNAWADANNAGGGGTIDDTLKQVQKKNSKDIIAAYVNLSTLKDNLKKLQESGNSDADTYREYYTDIKKLQTTVLNPPAGDIDNFGDDFEDQRNTVNSNLDMLEE